MKYPKIPTKPWAPYKPTPPAKQIEQRSKLGTQTSQEDSEFTIESLTTHIRESFPNVDPNKVKFHLEVEKEHGYYDEVYTHLNIHYFTVEMVDNPQYAKLYKNYQVQLEKYHFDYEKYKKDLEQYKLDEKQYKEDLQKWELERAKAIIAKHEGKKKK